MKKQFAYLTHIAHNQPITQESNYSFLYHLQHAILMALQEQGRLNAMEFRHAEEKLDQQRRERARQLLTNGESQ